MIDLQLAGSAERLLEAQAGWGPTGVSRMRWSIGLDFVLLLAYGATLYLGAVWAKHQWEDVWPALTWVGAVLSFGVLLAASLDAVENVLMLLDLGEDEPSERRVATVRILALAKFALVGVGFSYVVSGLVPYWWGSGGWWRVAAAVPLVAVLVVLTLTVRLLGRPGLRQT